MGSVQDTENLNASPAFGEASNNIKSKPSDEGEEVSKWADTDDPDSPYNWSMLVKASQLGTIAYMTLLS